MWKCKKCGGTDIGLEVWGSFSGYETGFDKNGNGGIEINDLNTEDSDKYICEDCENSGVTLKEVAEWIEE